jgi:hypothetical protein
VREGVVASTPTTATDSASFKDTDSLASEPDKTFDSDSGNPAQESSSPLQLFNLVLVIDKPDPAVNDELPNLAYDTFYREVILPWTAAAFLEQVRTGWIAQESPPVLVFFELTAFPQ